MTTVTWTQDVNSNYEVSSPEHLKQIMHKGALYTDAGSPPSSYWATGTNYKQTADIDLLSDSTDIKPIGVAAEQFLGIYDGGEFKISNWSYVDPNFGVSEPEQTFVGLFGSAGVGVIIKNMRLAGIWTIQGVIWSAGFLCGYLNDSGSTAEGIWNVEGDFSVGSLIDTNPGVSLAYAGSIVGYIRSGILEGVTLKGSIDFLSNIHSTQIVGGVVGYLYTRTSLKSVQNLATFPSGIYGEKVGGICGYLATLQTGISTLVNAMFGNINASVTAGGIAGNAILDNVTGATLSATLLNAMTGDISNSGPLGTGGIIGILETDTSHERYINYMTGNISSSSGDTSKVGGIIGSYFDRDPANMTSSINAMNGNVANAVVGVFDNGVASVTITTDTSYGLTFATDNHGTSTAPSGLLTTNDFSDLPYFTLDGTDTDGNTYDFDFVYANLAGNSSYSLYTHAILHKGDVSTPFDIDFDVPDNNTTLYTTFANAATKTFSQPLLSIQAPPLAVEQRSINIPVVIQEVTGATAYQITYEGPTGGEIVAFSGSTDLTYNIVGVEPDTTYTIKLYADTGAGLELSEQLSTTTLPNLAANYDITEFQDTNGVTDLTSLDASTLSNISSVIPELVNTGDVVSLSLVSNPELTTTSFVSLGGILDVTGIDGVLLPFQDTSGAGQTANITLSDNTTVPISYNESTSSITVESTPYSAGDSFVLQGNDVEVFDYYGLTVISIDEIIPLALEPRSINIPVTIAEVPGAIAYQITYEGPTGGEITALSGVTTLEHNITGLEPDTAYTIKLYADTGTGYELTEELTTTTLPNVAASYDVTDFQDTNGVTDLTSLDATTLSNLSGVITELVNTGDVVNVSLPNEPDHATSFVAVGENINIADVDGLLLPFDTTSGAGQTVTLTLSDTTTVPVTYDEVANTITVESVTYSSGDAIYLDGNKLEVFDYYGLTVVSVDVAPLLVEPGPINIPVVITEVPGAVGYNVTYQGPTGGEMTAFSGVTTLDQNITGLVSGTEYTIKLYADTGSGYVLTEELTATTLANVAANYDVNIFVEDGVINLSSLPDATISNIAEVMNELFNTGDIINVSVQGKPEVNTSFIKLGETLSIQELDGVLLPFVEASGTGQDVNVVLSDGTTTVAIDYDDTVNNITVNNVVYSPGDSFILDGKKVTVVEY